MFLQHKVESDRMLYDLPSFLRLSAALHYQLIASDLGIRNILSIILGHRQVPARDEEVLLQVLYYLNGAYGQKRRALGPLSVVHPLRAASLLARAQGETNILDLLSELLHDKLEDIRPEDLGISEWEKMEDRFEALIKQIDPTDEWYLMERIDCLTRHKETETYDQYIGRLLKRAIQTPELIRVKLADRLDNTLDMHMSHEDPLGKIDFFAHIFQIMFVSTYTGVSPDYSQPDLLPFSGARRLYELFKNAVFLSLLRRNNDISQDPTAQILFEAIASASRQEAQRMIIHIFCYHIKDTAEQRQLLEDFMDSIFSAMEGNGPVVTVTAEQRLHGLFEKRFGCTNPALRTKILDDLYDDKPATVETSLAFIVIFMSFLNDQEYFVDGITA